MVGIILVLAFLLPPGTGPRAANPLRTLSQESVEAARHPEVKVRREIVARTPAFAGASNLEFSSAEGLLRSSVMANSPKLGNAVAVNPSER